MSETSALLRRSGGMSNRRRPAPPRKVGPWPWLDRGGRFSTLRLSVLIALVVPGAVLLALLTDGARVRSPGRPRHGRPAAMPRISC